MKVLMIQFKIHPYKLYRFKHTTQNIFVRYIKCFRVGLGLRQQVYGNKFTATTYRCVVYNNVIYLNKYIYFIYLFFIHLKNKNANYRYFQKYKFRDSREHRPFPSPKTRQVLGIRQIFCL
jgi:hypothetical protein